MRSIRSIALSALLLATTATSTFAYDATTSTRQAVPTSERAYDDGGSYARPALPGQRACSTTTAAATPDRSCPSGERAYDDGGSYARPAARRRCRACLSTTVAAMRGRQHPASERANDDGGSYARPAAPASERAQRRWRELHHPDDSGGYERLRALGLRRGCRLLRSPVGHVDTLNGEWTCSIG